VLELRELRYFAAAARFGNLARAAQDLNVTASAVSQQLRKLEDSLGRQLLIRHGRGVTTTPTGARLLDRFDAILHLLNAPLDPEPSAADAAGAVSLAIPAEIGSLVVAPLLAQMRSRWPGATLDLQDNSGSGVETRLLDRQVDLAVLQDPPELDELRVAPLLTERLGLVMSPAHPLAVRDLPLRLRDLADATLILPGPRHWVRRLLARAAFQRGLRLDAALQADSVAMTKDMVRNGLGCTILPGIAVRDEIARGALVFRPIAQPALLVTHAIATRRVVAPVVRDIAQALGEVVHSLAATGVWAGTQFVRSPEPSPSLEPVQDVPPETWRLPRHEPARGSLEFVEGD
jgi:LysR family nitrogen assimilation transcriptional regulator